MDKRNKHIDRLTPDVIKAYQTGGLSQEQRHQVERLMLEDPFADEAMEGISLVAPEEMEQDLSDLSERIDNLTTHEKKRALPIWIKVAAVFVILAVSVSLFYLSSDKDLPKRELSELRPGTDTLDKENDTEQQKTPAPYDSINSDETTDQVPDAVSPGKAQKAVPNDTSEVIILEDIEPVTQGLAETPERITVEMKEAPEPIPASEISIPMKEFDIQLDSILNVRFEAGVESKESEPTLKSRSRLSNESAQRSFAAPPKQTSEVNQIRGIVRGADDGLPLPQVNVIEKGTTNGVPTSIEGEFTIFVKPKATLVVRYLGYVTQEVKTDGKLPLTIELIPDATSLGEVVVTGVASATDAKKLPFSVSKIRGGQIDGSRQGESRTQKSLEIVARPQGGFRAFNKYLKNNIRYPQAAREANLKGRVTLEFQVSASGALSAFRVVKGLGYGCDEEAIRLIKEGPEWNPRTVGPNKTPVSSTVKIRVRFRP